MWGGGLAPTLLQTPHTTGTCSPAELSSKSVINGSETQSLTSEGDYNTGQAGVAASPKQLAPTLAVPVKSFSGPSLSCKTNTYAGKKQHRLL